MIKLLINQSTFSDFTTFEGGHYRKGFLYKSLPMDALITDGVKPTVAEMEKFQDEGMDIQKELATTQITTTGHCFVPGDKV